MDDLPHVLVVTWQYADMFNVSMPTHFMLACHAIHRHAATFNDGMLTHFMSTYQHAIHQHADTFSVTMPIHYMSVC